jgi:hypothetical protein
VPRGKLPGACHGLGRQYPGAEYTQEETEFLRAMQRWMKANRCKFPSFADVLRVARSLGYRKVSPPLSEGEEYV